MAVFLSRKTVGQASWTEYFSGDCLSILEFYLPLQFGFHQNYSTSYALIHLTETIKQALDQGKYGCGIFVDLQKAFDTADHNILLGILKHYGIRVVAYG